VRKHPDQVTRLEEDQTMAYFGSGHFYSLDRREPYRMSDREHMGEPIPGTARRPPAGERVLWQGSPRWRTLARRTFHVRKTALYFAVLVAWRGIYSLMQGQDILGSDAVHPLFIGLSAAALGLLLLLAWLTARTTIYTITTERVVMRFGICHADGGQPAVQADPLGGREDLSAMAPAIMPLQLLPEERVSYIVMWPNVRPWSFGHAQPMLRGVDDAAKVAGMLSRALAGEPVSPNARTQRAADGFLAGGPQTAS
jgi:hypothetical protein